MPSAHPPALAVPGELIVKFRESSGPDQQAALLTGAGVAMVCELPLTDACLMRAATASPDEALAALQAHPMVLYAEPNYLWQPALLPNDPCFPTQWGLRNTGQSVGGSPGAPGVDISATAAWDVTLGDPTLIVAVIDTGTEINHADLVANIFTNAGEIAANGSDDDQNGFTDDVHGWNFFDNTNNVFTDPGNDLHGTHVSGIIAAVLNNALGVAGVAPRVKLLPLKFLGPNGGSTAAAISAISYARMMGAKVINASWGGGGFSQALMDAIRNSGALFVAAAGNSGTNNDTTPFYPASYNLPNLLAVAAVDNRGAVASFSSYGAISVHLAAPGVDIDSTASTGVYGYLSGTSMAAPHVSGVAALLLSQQPATTPATLNSLLRQTVKPLPALVGKVASAGMVDALQALANPAYGVAWGPHNTPTRLNPGEIVPVSMAVTNTGSMTWPAGSSTPVRLSYHWRDDKGNVVVWNGRRGVLPTDVAPGQSTTISIQLEAPGTPGSLLLQWDMVQEGVSWFESQGTTPLFVGVTLPPSYAADWISAQTPPKIARGSTTTATVKMRNLGSYTWPAGGVTPVHLSYHWLNAASQSVIFNGLRTVLPGDIAPNEAVVLTASVQAPGAPGTYTLQWDLVREGVTWFGGAGVAALVQTIIIT